MDEGWLEDRIARARREALEAKDELVGSHPKIPSGAKDRFRSTLLDIFGDLERDIAAMTKSDLGLDRDTVLELARLLRTARDGTPSTTMRRFQLHRDVDETGVSGTGVVAEGALWEDGDVAVVRWNAGEFPTSVVWHDRGRESIEAVHGHGGYTRIVFLDD